MFKKYTANIAASAIDNFTGRNVVIFKPAGCEISIYRDSACTKPLIAIGAAAVDAKFHDMTELAGEAYIKSSVDAQTVIINQW